MDSFDYLTLLLFGFVLLSVGISKWGRTESSYLIADRQVGFWALTATLIMTEFNTATLISFAGLGYVAGLWALLLPAVFLIGLLFYAISVAKKWKAFNGLSVATFFSQRYGSDIGKLASFTLLIAMAGFSATYVKSLTLLFMPFFSQPSEWPISGYLVILTLLMMLRGGLLSVVYTDILSCLITCIFLPLMAFYAWNHSSITEIPSLQTVIESGSAAVPFWFFTSLVVLTMFTYILAPWYGQKIFAAANDRVAYLAVICAAIVIFCLYSCAVLSTAFLKLQGSSLSNPEQALPYVINHSLPNGLRGLGYGIFFAASATTLAGVWGAMTAMFIEDFCQYTPTQGPTRAFLVTTGFAALSYLLSNLLVDQILNKLILANIPVAALSFALLAGFYWDKASRFGAYCSIITGLVVGVGSYLFWGEAGGYTWYWAVGGIPLIFAAGILGSYCYPASLKIGYLKEQSHA